MPSDADTIDTPSSPNTGHVNFRIHKAFLPEGYESPPPSKEKDITAATHGKSLDRSPSNKDALPEPMVYQTMKQKIEEWSDEDDECFTVCDLGDVYRQHLRWKTHLPRVEPFYGMLPASFFFSKVDTQILTHAYANCSRQMQ